MRTRLIWLAFGLFVAATAASWSQEGRAPAPRLQEAVAATEPIGAPAEQPAAPAPAEAPPAPAEPTPMAPAEAQPPAPAALTTTAPERVEYTAEQLEQMINAPPAARLGRELDEPDKPFALFSDKKRIAELLGEEPGYVYQPMGTDPMIVPWVRNRVMAAELVQEARELVGNGKYDEALAKVDLVLERFGDTDSVEKARELKMQIDKLKQSAVPPPEPGALQPPPDKTVVSLPVWITENTKGVIFDVKDPKNSTVLIGEYILHVGDMIPSFPGIKIAAIDKSSVTMDYQGQSFRLRVEGN